MKRRVRTIGVFLILGAVMNIAVAWGCAHRVIMEPRHLYWTPERGGTRTTSGEYLSWSIRKAAGVVRVKWSAGLLVPEMEKLRPPDRAAPYWTTVASHPCFSGANSVHREEFGEWVETGSGWPCVAMRSRTTSRQDPLWKSPAVLYGSLTESLGIHPPPDYNDWNPASLPATPIILGFTVNSILYGMLGWLVVCGRPVLRRTLRRSRGLCPSCAYNLQHDLTHGCPECGWGRDAVEAES